jgi:hypothetical protein
MALMGPDGPGTVRFGGQLSHRHRHNFRLNLQLVASFTVPFRACFQEGFQRWGWRVSLARRGDMGDALKIDGKK